MRLFSLKTCDSCRKAVSDLRAAGFDPEIIDVRADGVASEDLARFVAAFGDPLVNRRSTTWRGLSESERSRSPVELLSQYPTLMKRPVIDTGDAVFLGWDAKTRSAVLG
ncbi:MAG: arsenate reductase [Paracoccaceae bacterium]|nr:arsenate reductase [Paracoccaceae bacterium]